MNPCLKDAPDRPLRCLVTGGLGYAGAWISARLAEAGHTVYILSRREAGADIGQPYTLVSADLEKISPAKLCFLLPEDLDCVVHAASYNEHFDPEYPRKALLANALGTRNFLEALVLQGQRHSQPLPLCIYLSTFHVYGRGDGRITEKDTPAPLNDYALTHYFAEEYLRMFGRRHALPSIILRVSNGYGAPRTPDSDKWYLLLNDLCKSAVVRGEVPLRSDPSISRDFVWLGDLAMVAEKLLRRRDLAGSVLNVASGKAVSIGEVAGLVALTASQHLKKLVQVLPVHGENDQQPLMGSGHTPASLHISNKAVCSVLGITFQNRMREEIVALLELALRTRTGAAMAAKINPAGPKTRETS